MCVLPKWNIYTPEGVQDILFEDCFMKRNLESKIRQQFRACGFYEIETPSIEFYDVFSGDSAIVPQEMMFKFFDQQGRILVLRPDLTVPVARIAATKYKDMDYPLKVFYIGNSFKYNEYGGGKQKEYTEAGLEILGADTPEADAEVIAAAINTVKSVGIDSFQVDIGQVEFFKGLMEETGLSEQCIEQIRVLIDHKDFLGIEEMIMKQNIDKSLQKLILSLPGLFGSIDVIDSVEKMTKNQRSIRALENLRSILDILDDYGLTRYVSVDLGMVQKLNYYTGTIFRGFTYGIGFPVFSGGRYDGLVGSFGRECPAAGFSIGINMVMMAIDRQKIAAGKPYADCLVSFGREGRRDAFLISSELRKQGLLVEMDITGRTMPELVQYASKKGIGGILHILDKERIEIYNIGTDETVKTTKNELLNRGISM